MANTTDIRKALDDLAKHFELMGDYADVAGHHAWQYEAAEDVREWAQKNFSQQG